MRAVQLSAFGLDHLDAVDLSTPRPGPNEVLVQMEAASLNYIDYVTAIGQLYRAVQLPLVPLADGAGTVLEVGDAVTRFRPGDRVTTQFKSHWVAGSMRREWEGRDIGIDRDGVMREQACFDQYSLVKAPAHLASTQAATLPIAALTAWQSLEQANLTSGQTVLVLGTGGVSLFALQFAKARGARVIVLSSSDEKLERARTIGANIGINYTRHPEWAPLVREATDGTGVDVVVETVGGSTLAQSLAAVRMHGFIGMVGFLGGGEANVSLLPLIAQRVRLEGISVAPLEANERMVAAIESIGLEPVVDRTFGFGQLREAFEHMASGQHFGKIAIDFGT